MSIAPYWPNEYDSQVVINQQADLQPYSSIQIFPTRVNTVGFLPAMGSLVSRTRYIDLFNASSSTEALTGFFQLPALVNKDNSVLRFGLGNTALYRKLENAGVTNYPDIPQFGGNTSNSVSVTLNISNVPPHAHQSAQQGDGFAAASGGNGNRANNSYTGSAILDASGTVVTQYGNSPTPLTFDVTNMYASLFPCYRSCYKAPDGWLRGGINIDTTNNIICVSYPVFYINGELQPWASSQNVVCRIQPGLYKNGHELGMAVGNAVKVAVSANPNYTGGVLQSVAKVYSVGNSDWALQFVQTQMYGIASQYAAFFFPVNTSQNLDVNELYAYSAECLGFVTNKYYVIQANDNTFPPNPNNAILVPDFPAKFYESSSEA